MSLKIEFIERAEKGEKIAGLCREYGISRTAGHKWLKRFREQGYDGLEDESRRPKTTPLATAEDLVLAVLEAREKHPRWGPRKLRGLLQRRYGDGTPSVRTIARILKRANKVRERRRKAPVSIVDRAPMVSAASANDVWTIDFKGYWRTLDGAHCEPLTVRDAYSRYVLAIEVCPKTTKAVRDVLEQLFRKHGVPNAMQCDNGTPFVAVTSRGGVSALSAWWLSLGIRVVRSRPGCPQDNGGHERMHRDVASDVESRPSTDSEGQRRVLARWRQEFNEIRPHDALQLKTPAEVYGKRRGRPFRVRPFAYPPHLVVRRIGRNGTFKLDEERYFLSTALRGHDVGVELVDALHVRAWFNEIDLGLVEIVPDVTPRTFDLLDARRSRRERSRAA